MLIGFLLQLATLDLVWTIENEIFSIINRIQSQTSFDNLNEPQLIVHLSPINNNVILFADNLVTIIPILISDLDEALLLELSELNDTSTELWNEFGIRVGENIRLLYGDTGRWLWPYFQSYTPLKPD